MESLSPLAPLNAPRLLGTVIWKEPLVGMERAERQN